MQIVDFRRQNEQFYVNQFRSKFLTENYIDIKVCLIIFLDGQGAIQEVWVGLFEKRGYVSFFLGGGGKEGGGLMRRLVVTCSDAPLSPAAPPGSSSSAS